MAEACSRNHELQRGWTHILQPNSGPCGFLLCQRLHLQLPKCPYVQALQAQLVQVGLHRVFGAWLCSLPKSGADAVALPLLRALAKVPCSGATLSWLHRRGVHDFVVELTKSADSSLKERATALKVLPCSVCQVYCAWS